MRILCSTAYVSGLTVILYVEKLEYLAGYTSGDGYQISITPWNSMAVPKDGGISLAPGYETSIGLQYVSTHYNLKIAEFEPT